MPRSLLTVLLAFALVLVASAQEDPPTIEQMQAAAREQVKQQNARIKAEVMRACLGFGKGDMKPAARRSEIENLVGLGLGAVPHIVAAMKESQSAAFHDFAADVLVRMVEEKRATVAEISAAMRDRVDAGKPREIATAVRVLGRIGDKNSIDAVRLQLDRNEAPILAACLETLARFGDDSIEERLEKSAAHEDPEVRIGVMKAVGLLGDSGLAELAIDRLEDDDDGVVRAAILSFKSLGKSSKAMRALHDILETRNDKRVELAIRVIEEINKGSYSIRHLSDLVKDDKRNFDIRKRAARAMFVLGDEDGVEFLARGYKAIIRQRPKDPRNHQQLAEFYAEFGAWSEAARAWEKALDNTNRAARQDDLRLQAARSWARDGSFKRAAALLKKTPRGSDWSDLRDDAAFEEMRKDRRYRDNFVR